MTARVYNLAEARERPRPKVATVRFRIEPNGDLSIREVRDDGVSLRAIVIDDGQVDDILRQLTIKRARRRGALGTAPVVKPKVARCLQRRDGGARRHRDGCRRHEGHKGRCRDAGGDYTPAICSHIGMGRTHVMAEGETYQACKHCNARRMP